MTLTDKAYAKINLSLDIVSKMDDGYHALRTVMQSVNLCDEITVESEAGSRRSGNISVISGLPYVPSDERNIAVKAAKAFFEYTDIRDCPLKISVKKSIPVCAGLGGGSTDAACVLRMLDKMLQTQLGSDILEQIGLTVGADVPFCVKGGTRLAEGRGEIMTQLVPLPECFVVICKPMFSFSTAEIFACINVKKIRARPDTAGLIKAVESGDIDGVAKRMYNVFEDFLPRGREDIDAIKNLLLDNGALGAVMTGSGSSVFGLFDNKTAGENAYEQLSDIYKDCFLTETR